MNLRFYIICIAAVLALVAPSLADSNNTATIHGEVYVWDTFEPLENAVVEVNSTPSQSMVTKYGLYSFKLAPGDYSITAKYYQNSTLIYSAEEIAQIKDEGDYVKDLLLLPVYSEELMDSFEEASTDGINNSDSVSETEESGIDSSAGSSLLIALALFMLLAGGYQFSRKRKVEKKSIEPEMRRTFQANTEEIVSSAESVTEPEPKITVTGQVAGSEPKLPEKKAPAESKEYLEDEELAGPEPEEENEIIALEEPAGNPEIETPVPEVETPLPKKKLPLPADLQEVMDIIRGQGGRITQKDLRSRLKYSEGKVSLMLADLERRELIEKFKRGRGNVVILKDEER